VTQKNSGKVQEERTETYLVQALSYSSVYSFLPEQYPRKPIVKDGYPQNVTSPVNTTVNILCLTHRDFESDIEWIKMSKTFKEGMRLWDDYNATRVQVRGADNKRTCFDFCGLHIIA
jgi:hypothetical protein